MARTSLWKGTELDESDDAVTKLLQISALSLSTLLFAACDPEIVDGDLLERELHGELVDRQDDDGEDEGDDLDGGFEIDDDFSDAEFVPAPMVEYDLADGDEDEDEGPSADLPFANAKGDDG